MGEDKSNFQEFYNSEKLEILAMLEELPEGFHKQQGLKYLVRRIDGQDHPDPAFKTASALAHSGKNTIEFMYRAFLTANIEFTRRVILHEKAHFLWAYTFDESVKNDWIEIGGWFEDPTADSGWSTYNTTEFVSAYAHLKDPNEDMAESISIYLTNPDRLINVSMKKYEFIRDRIMHGTRYIAQIREDLTFTVYNLYPDYIFPGKIIEVDILVEGKSEEDKVVKMRVVLNSTDPTKDGGVNGFIRFASQIGTTFDLGLRAENGSIDSVLVGEANLSKFLKSGYYSPAQILINDQAGNTRYEKTSTVGIKLYVENTLEDIIYPKFIPDRYSQELIRDYISGGWYDSKIDSVNGTLQQAVKYVYAWEDKNLDFGYYGGALTRTAFPFQEDGNVFFKEAPSKIISQEGDITNLEAILPIKEYYPTGYYKPVQQYSKDMANQFSDTYFVENLDEFIISEELIGRQFKIQRDSIYIETEFPDIQKPEIDINQISVRAEPSNPDAPNGETRVDIDFFARDLSDFPGKESGFSLVVANIRSPEGKEFRFDVRNPNVDDNHPAYNSDWYRMNLNFLLPAGSAPGIWGISSMYIEDLVGNGRHYSFVEYVRFDVIESDVVLDEPLQVEIMDKVINAGNVDSIRVKMSCIPCQGLGYVATIYSRFGGGAVVRSEGILDGNEVIIEDLNTTGILDGEVNLTVQLVDSESNLITQKSVAYTKDVVYPSAYYTRSNLQDEGHSNLDDLVVDVEYSSEDEEGTYTYKTGQATTSGIRNARQIRRGYPSVKYSISPSAALQTYTGELVGDVSIDDIDLSATDLGLLYGKLSVTDPNGNKGQDDVTDYFVVTLSGARIKRIKKYRDNDTDFDDDGVVNEQDAFPYDASETLDTDSDGIGNNADTDDDGDDWSDEDETAEGTDPLDAQLVPVDTDGDGIGNVTDTDDDGDEVPDTEDAFPLDPTEAYDADGDGVGDNADDDDDNDQVKDVNDECPNSAYGVTVDAAGCEVFSLPSNTFTVSVTSATCPDSSNGSITISSSNTEYSYRYAIDDQAPQALTDNTQTISNLSAGIYTICVTVDGVSDYQRCYTIEIKEPAPLVASSRVDVSSRNLQLDLSGSSEYQITLNGKSFLTTDTNLSLNLVPGMNRIEVATALDCQGVYFEEIFVSEEVKVYPNPTSGPLQLFVAGSDSELALSITSLSGGMLRRETLSVPSNRIIETSLGNLPEGLYLITLNGTTVKTTHKVIKE